MKKYKNLTATFLKVALLSVLLSGLTGCGFKLRGAYTLPEVMQKIYVQGSGDLLTDLKETLAYSAEVVSKKSDADAILVISKEELKKRTLSVDSRGKIREAELEYTVLYSVITPAGNVLLDQEPVVLVRDYVDDQNDVIGRSNEAQLITKDLKRDASQRIVRRLQTLDTTNN